MGKKLNALAAEIGISVDEMCNLADRHTQEVQIWLDTRSPQAERFDGRGLRAAYSGIRVPLLNQVMGVHYPAKTPADDIVHELAAVHAFFDQRGVPSNCWLSPFSWPENIEDELNVFGYGFRSTLPAMVAPLPMKAAVSIPAEIQVWRADSDADLVAAGLIRAEAFRFPPGVGLDYFTAMAEDWLNDPVRLFLAGVSRGQPAAIGALILAQGIPGVYIMATLKAWQRRGIGKAILNQIMRVASDMGHRMIALTASKFGYPLYQQFGFEQVFEYEIYTSRQ
jgi:GNAT superfamily N-acetyltransferase